MSKSELPSMPSLPTGVYRHNKSANVYEVLGLALHSESKDVLVLYRPLYELEEDNAPDYWVRPYAMFVEEVEIDGQKRPCFEYLGKSVDEL